MQRVEAEHIAYAFVQVCILIWVFLYWLSNETYRLDSALLHAISGRRLMVYTTTVMSISALLGQSKRHLIKHGQRRCLIGGMS